MNMVATLRRVIPAFILVVALTLSANSVSAAGSDTQQLIDRARITVQAMKLAADADVMRSYIQRAKAVVVIPAFAKGSFIVGGAHGNGVILGRNGGSGPFNAPGFMELIEGSIGLQIGGEISEIILTVLTEDGLKALLNNKVSLGAQAGISVLSFGAGRETATTTNFDADILTFQRSKGLFGGMSVDGAVFSNLPKWNAAYYGQGFAVEDIVLHGKAWNDGANELRRELDTF